MNQQSVQIDGRNFASTIGALPDAEGIPTPLLNIAKEMLIQLAMNVSDYKLALVATPYKLESEPDVVGLLLQLQVESEAVAPVHRMTKIEKMTRSFKTRSVSLKMENATADVLEATYLLNLGNDEIFDDQVIYAISEEKESAHRQVMLADLDIFSYLMTGMLKGEPFGPEAAEAE